MDYLYQANFCEENIWWLAQDPYFEDSECYVCIAAHPSKKSPSIQVRFQKGGTTEDMLVKWDYHVFLFAKKPNEEFRAWDFDTTLGFPIDASAYMLCFLSDDPEEQAMFRVIPREDYIEHFGSDRGHVQSIEPVWEPIQPEKDTLDTFRTLSLETVGEVFTLPDLLSFLLREV